MISEEFGIGQPAVSMQLKVLRESGFATVRAEGRRRLYAIEPAPLAQVDAWLSPFRGFWEQRLDALATELRRRSRLCRVNNDSRPRVRQLRLVVEAEDFEAAAAFYREPSACPWSSTSRGTRASTC